MTTVNDVVNEAFRKAGLLGIGQTMDGGDIVSGLADFNDMVSQWFTQRWMTWGLLDLAFTSTGATSYTVGPGGNFNVAVAPMRIEAAYQRQLVPTGLQVDTPLEIIPSNEEYSRLAIKGLISFGLYVFYDTSTLPLATLANVSNSECNTLCHSYPGQECHSDIYDRNNGNDIDNSAALYRGA